MESPSRSWRWGVWHAADKAWLEELQRRHAKLQDCGGKEIVAAPRIPKCLHQIWLGPHAIPARCHAWMQTWRDHHPDWNYKLWRDSDVEELALKNEKAYREATNYGEKSDIARYEILARMGGVYIDIDMECLRRLDSLLNHYAFVVGMSNTACVEINNAVIASCPDHPILQRLIDKIYTSAHAPRLDASMLARIALLSGVKMPQSNASMSTIERTGPGLMTRTFMEAIGWSTTTGFLPVSEQDAVMALPIHILYPLANNAMDQEKHLKNAWPSDAIAVHYWERTWQHNPY